MFSIKQMSVIMFATLPRSSVAFGLRKASVNNKNLHRLSAGNNIFTDFVNSFSTMTQTKSGRDVYTVAITGASGLVGKALINELESKGEVNGKQTKIIQMKRSGSNSEDALVWDPQSTGPALDPSLLEDVDVVVHLAGENVSSGEGPLGFLGIRPWTASKKDKIMDSREQGTKAIAEAVRLANLNGGLTRPKTQFLSTSAVGVYGMDGVGSDAKLWDESSDTSSTEGFLAEVSRRWEAAAETAASGGSNGRVVTMRFGVVLSKLGGALAKLYPIFLVGGGGIVGSGEQYFPYVSIRDLSRGIVHIMETPSLKGPVNIVGPNCCTNTEFTKALGSVINRPTILPLPGFAVSALFGQMGDDMLLGGQKVVSEKLLKSGFVFNHDTVEKALKSAIEEDTEI